MKKKFTVSGMSCAACSARVEQSVSALRGVSCAAVNLLQNSLEVEWDPSLLKEQDIICAVEQAGYGAAPAPMYGGGQTANPAQLQEKQLKIRFWFSLLFLLPLFYLAMGPMWGLPLPSFLAMPHHAGTWALVQLMLALPVVYINREIFKNGLLALWHRAPNMNSLISLGSGASILYGLVQLPS